MRSKLIKLAGSTIVAVAMASIALTAMPQAALAAPAVEKATGSIVMGAPGQDHNEKQAITFNVFERDTNKGNVTYTNFQYADEGSGVWAFGDAPFDVSFEYAGLCNGACVHTLQVTDFQPLSPTSLSFEGTGVYASNPTWTETFTGTIVGNKIALTLDADDDGALYQWNVTTLSGTITPQGSISGTWKDDISRGGSFEIASGAVSEVFSFTTPVTCATVTPGVEATFNYTIPASASLAPLAPVAVRVTDGGASGTDTYGHSYAAGSGCSLPAGAYVDFPIQTGNLVVHAA